MVQVVHEIIEDTFVSMQKGIDSLTMTDGAGGIHELSCTNLLELELDGIVVASPSFLGVTSVTNTDGSITSSPTTGAVFVSLNTAHANTWTGLQTLAINNTNDSPYLAFENDAFTSAPIWWIGNGGFPIGPGNAADLALYTHISRTFRIIDRSGTAIFSAFTGAGVGGLPSTIQTANNTLDDGSGNLTVSGNIQTSTFEMTTGASAGYELISDASGNATWTAPPSGVSSLNTLTGALAITTPNSTLSVGTSGSDIAVDINLSHANTWTATQTFNSGSGADFVLTNYYNAGNWVMSFVNSNDIQYFTISSAASNYVIADRNSVVAFNVEVVSKAVSTANNTLDDGSGKMTVVNFQMTTGATAGYILTSDALGNASWSADVGPVSSVSNSDSTLTISPTTGAVIASLNLAQPNTWTGTQTFSGNGSPGYDMQFEFGGTGNWVFGKTGAGNDFRFYTINTSASNFLVEDRNTAKALGVEVVSKAVTTANNTLDDGTGVQKNNTAPATLTGATAGTVDWTQPQQGTAYKLFVAQAFGYENTGVVADTITFPTAFANTPIIVGNDTGMVLTVSTTTLTFPTGMSSVASGNIIIMGY